MKTLHKVIIGFVCLYLSGCTWVDLSAEGEKVRVLSAAEVEKCKRVGKTTVSTAGKLGVLERYPEKIQAELDTLARNSAKDLGGDTVVPLAEPLEGRQVYEVYRCLPE